MKIRRDNNMAKKDEKRFTFEDKDYIVRPASASNAIEAQKVYNKAFKKAIEEGAILKKSLEDHMRRQGLWDDHKQEEYDRLIKKSADIEYKIKSGQYKLASQLKDKSFELKRIRSELSELLMVRNSMDSATADGIADNQRFYFLISACVIDYETQKPVFSSLDEYLEKQDSELAIKCAEEFANFAYGLEEDYEDKLLENRVLGKLGLLNKKGQLVNKQGQRVDIEGNLLNDEGARIDKDGNRIDINNNPVLEDDVIDSLEFEDDLENIVEDVKPATKSRASSAKRAKKRTAAATEEAAE
tara:strand:- start:1428 stop:2324 length:897 start_codon:yes stop_codon:yes gene_type:complete